MADISPPTGRQLLKLLTDNGWEVVRKANHGVSIKKRFRDRTRVAIVPDKNEQLPAGTFSAILGPKQTNLKKAGLRQATQQVVRPVGHIQWGRDSGPTVFSKP